MPAQSVTELTHTLNLEARNRFSNSPESSRTNGPIERAVARLALRFKTRYPYTFIEDDSLLPSDDRSFGRVIRRGRREGLEEIHDSIGTAVNEHFWLFVPSDKPDDSMWIDTVLEANEYSVNVDSYPQKILSHLHPEIETVHTHPDITGRKIAQKETEFRYPSYLLEAAQPSGFDFEAHRFEAKHISPDCTLVSTVVSHYGATTVTASRKPADLTGMVRCEYDRQVRDTSNPVEAIREALGRMSSSILRPDGTPAFIVSFEPIQ